MSEDFMNNEVIIVGSSGTWNEVCLITSDSSPIYKDSETLLQSNNDENVQITYHLDDASNSVKERIVKLVPCEGLQIDSCLSDHKHCGVNEDKTPNADLKNVIRHKSTMCQETKLIINIADRQKFANVFLSEERKKNSKYQNKKKIPPVIFKDQLMHTSDIISPLILLPHTKELMKISSWNFSKSILLPQRPISNKHQKLFKRNCIISEERNEFDTSELNLMPLGYKPVIDLSKVKRIVRKRKNPCMFISDAEIQAKETIDTEPSVLKSNDGNISYVEALVETVYDDDSCFFVDADISDAEEITVVPDGEGIADTTSQMPHFYSKSNNIDVLLAAAANNTSNNIVMFYEPATSNIEM